jgi:hypothetical protein
VVDEEVSEAKLAANGIILIYMLFTIAAVVIGALGVWWGVLAILIMSVLTYGIAPGYPEVILLLNYALFALLVVIALLALANVPGMDALLILVIVVTPVMVIGAPMGHILYLVALERRKLKQVSKIPRAPSMMKKAPVKKRPTPQEEVSNKLSRGIALICGYEKLKASHAFGLLLLRTALTWIIGSAVILFLSKWLGII